MRQNPDHDCVHYSYLAIIGSWSNANEALIRPGGANGRLGRGIKKINGQIRGYGSPMA